MLIGYVSDEDYSALADVAVEFDRSGETVYVTRSTARGAVFAELEAGEYRVTLQRAGFGSKRSHLTIPDSRVHAPHQFRLLSDRLCGYAWPKWCRSGERAEYRVHSVEPYHLSLWRYGIEKELVQQIGWFDAHGPRTVMQITPDGDYTLTGAQWNRVGWGSPHHTQRAEAPDRSGLYYFHARGESGAFFSFPWVVAPAHPANPIAVLASTNTWNAYNVFGGRSNYVNARELPAEPTVNARQDLQRYHGGAYDEWLFGDFEYQPLSFDRPERGNHVPENVQATDRIAGRDACHLAPAEWRLLAWMEREGYGYDLYSEWQLHDCALDLAAYRVLMLSTHPEYWSREMYERVKAWVRDGGGRLVYLGGNGINCEVELLDGFRTRSLTRVPSSGESMGGAGIESRFHRTVECEANLLGVVCTDAGIMTAAPYRVARADHWVFEETGLRDGDTFGHESLHERVPGGASGHETDKRSRFSPPRTVLLAKGMNPDEGGAEMVAYETESGGAVFSVGSITWPASVLVDDHVSRITRNVLAQFLSDSGGI